MPAGESEREYGPADIPDIFPLPAPVFHQYAYVQNLDFGWVAIGKGEDVKFTVWGSKKWSGIRSVLRQWPLSESGWHEAWSYVAAEHPTLAEAIIDRSRRDASRRAATQAMFENKAALESEGQIAALTKCVFLGGYGFDEGLVPGTDVDLYFTQHGLWVTKSGDYTPYLRRSYVASLAFDFEGGAVRTGGRYVGGGFGALGAAEGMAIASLLNALTAKTKVHTTIRFEADDAEMFFFTDQAVPRTLEMRFAEARAQIRNARPENGAHQREASDNFADRLLRLGEMRDRDQLTNEEFAAAKARLLAGD
jgi:hypothetical protein